MYDMACDLNSCVIKEGEGYSYYWKSKSSCIKTVFSQESMKSCEKLSTSIVLAYEL